VVNAALTRPSCVQTVSSIRSGDRKEEMYKAKMERLSPNG
jgi:hypothetical protein